MNKESMEIRQRKFEKLSDANKIRYHLGAIMSSQFRIMLLLGSMSTTILGCLFILPFFIWYVEVGRILMLAGMGFLLILVTFILFFVGILNLNKLGKGLEDFLNKKQKK